MDPIDQAFVTEALNSIDTYADVVNMRDGHSAFWGADELTKKLLRTDHEVEWECVNTQISFVEGADGGTTSVLKDGGEQAAWDDGYFISKVPNINSIQMKQSVAGCSIKFGVTSDPENNHKMKDGYYIGIFDEKRAVRADQGKETTLCKYELNESFRVQMQNGGVVVYKNDDPEPCEALGMCPEKGTSMYGMVHIRERDALGQLLGLQSIAMVTSIDICGNYICDAGVERLCEALEAPFTKVSILDLGLNRIKDDGAIRLSKALEYRNNKIQILGLCHNEICDDGAARLAEAMPKSKVTSLYLTGNEIENQGAIKLADCVESEDCKLTVLELSWNFIADEGAQRLCQAISQQSCKLQYFSLAHNKYIDKKTKTMLTKIMGQVPRLLDMTCGGNLLNGLREGIMDKVEDDEDPDKPRTAFEDMVLARQKERTAEKDAP